MVDMARWRGVGRTKSCCWLLLFERKQTEIVSKLGRNFPGAKQATLLRPTPNRYKYYTPTTGLPQYASEK